MYTTEQIFPSGIPWMVYKHTKLRQSQNPGVVGLATSGASSLFLSMPCKYKHLLSVLDLIKA